MIIRAYKLKPGDIFRRGGGVVYRVSKRDKNIHYYNYTQHTDGGSAMRTMGSKSQERVELIKRLPKYLDN